MGNESFGEFLMPPHPDSFHGRILLGVIDKLVVGLLAAGIVFSVQKCTQDREDRRQQLIAAASLESQFIASTLNKVNRNMIAYYQVATNLMLTGGKKGNKENSKMMEYKVTIKQSLFLLEKLAGPHIIQKKHKSNFKKLIKSMAHLNSILGKDSKNNPTQERPIRASFDKVQEDHGKVLRDLREAALKAVGLERAVAVTIESANETDQAE